MKLESRGDPWEGYQLDSGASQNLVRIDLNLPSLEVTRLAPIPIDLIPATPKGLNFRMPSHVRLDLSQRTHFLKISFAASKRVQTLDCLPLFNSVQV